MTVSQKIDGQQLGSSHSDSQAGEMGFFQDLYIVVVRGEPRDSRYARNVDIRIEFNGNPRVNWTKRVRGTAPNMRGEELEDIPKAQMTPNFERLIHVATVKARSADDPTLRNAVTSMDINREIGDTSQQWVDSVMANLEDLNLIDSADSRWSIDQMTDVICEAPDSYVEVIPSFPILFSSSIGVGYR